MAKKESKVITERQDTKEVETPQKQAQKLFAQYKTDHFNNEPDSHLQIPCSSLIANSIMGGGLPSGATRAIGNSSGGKSSCSLDFMLHFLSTPSKRRGVYVDSEGKLNKNIKERSGIKFVTTPEEWEDGTCLILQTNVFEFVFSFFGDLMRNNQTGTKYFFIVDSVDMLSRREDLVKPYEDSAKVAGGATLTSVFLKQTSAAMAKRGHFCIFISQVRDAVKIDPRQKTDSNKQGKASGGHALEHAPEWVLDFQPRYQDDIIREKPEDKNSKPIGHYCTIKVIKSNNETYGQEIRYPIKYGRTGGKSVWIEYELTDMLIMWEHIQKKGSWFTFVDQFRSELNDVGIEIPEKVQGIDSIRALLEENAELTKYLYNKFKTLN